MGNTLHPGRIARGGIGISARSNGRPSHGVDEVVDEPDPQIKPDRLDFTIAFFSPSGVRIEHLSRTAFRGGP